MSSVPPGGSPPLPQSLIEALGQARTWGFLGDGPLDVQVAHAEGFADAADGTMSGGPWMDLGSGGGIPGLVLAHRWPDRGAVLLDSSERRTRFLAQVVEDQGWGSRVRVVTDRAEVAGHSEDLRGVFSLVVARSFGSPPVTAECAAPFLRQGGILIVSEPPVSSPGDDGAQARWPEKGLASVGLERLSVWRGAFGYQLMRQKTPCPERFARRVGVPAKRPLYRVGDGPPPV